MSLGFHNRPQSARLVGVPTRQVVPKITEPAPPAVPTGMLRYANLAMATLHTVLAVVTITVGNASLGVPLYKTELIFVENFNSTPRFVLAPEYVQVGTLPLTVFVMLFFLISATAHAGNATLWRAEYEEELRQRRCTFRWIEYGLSASVMMMIIGIGVGMGEYTQLIALVALTATTMTFGWLAELRNELGADGNWRHPRAMRVMPHLLGYLPQGAAWVMVLASFYDESNATPGDRAAPSFVYAIIWSELLLFMSFALVQLGQILAPPRHYWRGELAFQALSLGSKATLGGLVLGNVLVLGTVADAY